MQRMMQGLLKAWRSRVLRIILAMVLDEAQERQDMSTILAPHHDHAGKQVHMKGPLATSLSRAELITHVISRGTDCLGQ